MLNRPSSKNDLANLSITEATPKIPAKSMADQISTPTTAPAPKTVNPDAANTARILQTMFLMVFIPPSTTSCFILDSFDKCFMLESFAENIPKKK